MEQRAIIERKKSLRKYIKQLKQDRSDSWKSDASYRILSILESLDLFKSSNTVLLYHALPDEVQTAPFLDKWYGIKRIVIPLVVGDILELKLFSPDQVIPGYRGIPEPVPTAQTISPSEIDLAVIPGVAFDSHCNRLGRGKGFYDKLIPNLKSPLIGLGFDFQVVDEIPVEIFDRKLDMVLTETYLFERI